MKRIVEAFARNSSCSNLTIDHLDIGPTNVLNDPMVIHYSEYLAILLITFSRHVKRIHFRNLFNPIYDYNLLACSLRYNTNIEYFDLSGNNAMSREAIANIAQALSFNETVKVVDFRHWLLAIELEVFLTHYAHQRDRSRLNYILVGCEAVPSEMGNQIIEKINRTRGLSENFHVARHIDWDHCMTYSGFETKLCKYT